MSDATMADEPLWEPMSLDPEDSNVGTHQIYGNVGLDEPVPGDAGTHNLYGNVGVVVDPTNFATHQIYGNVEEALEVPPATVYATGGNAQVYSPSPDAVEYFHFNVGVMLPEPSREAVESFFFNVGVRLDLSREAVEYLYYNVDDLAALVPHIWWVRPDVARQGWQIKIVGMGLQDATAALGPNAMVTQIGSVPDTAPSTSDRIIDGRYKTTNVAHQYLLAYVPMGADLGVNLVTVEQPDGLDAESIRIVEPYDTGVQISERGRVALTSAEGDSVYYAGTSFFALSPDNRWGFAVGLTSRESQQYLAVWAADMTEADPRIKSRALIPVGDVGEAVGNRYRLFDWGREAVLIHNEYNTDGTTWDTVLRDVNHTAFGNLSNVRMAKTDGIHQTKDFDFSAFDDKHAHLLLRTHDDQFVLYQAVRGLGHTTRLRGPVAFSPEGIQSFGGIIAIGVRTALIAWESDDALLVSTVDVLTGELLETVQIDDPEGQDTSRFFRPTLDADDSYNVFKVGDGYAVPYYYASASHEYHLAYLDIVDGLRLVQDVVYAVEVPGVDQSTQGAVVGGEYVVLPNGNLFSVVHWSGQVLQAFDNFPENDIVNLAESFGTGLLGVFLDEGNTPTMAAWNVEGLQYQPPRYPRRESDQPILTPWLSERDDLELVIDDTGRWRR